MAKEEDMTKFVDSLRRFRSKVPIERETERQTVSD